MICPNCKKEIDNDSTFCEFCGQDLRKKKSNAGLIVGILLLICVLIGGAVFAVLHFAQPEDDFPNEERVISQIHRFSNAVDRDDFATISDCYAQDVERYHNDRNTNNQRVVKDYQKYNSTFGVYGKSTNVHDDSFVIQQLNDSVVYVEYIENFHIDRYNKNKFKDFVLRKHVKLNKDYRIISIYDDQLEKSK